MNIVDGPLEWLLTRRNRFETVPQNDQHNVEQHILDLGLGFARHAPAILSITQYAYVITAKLVAF
jgi:hypothetical protein